MILYAPMFRVFHLENWKKFVLKNLQRTCKELAPHFNKLKLSDNSKILLWLLWCSLKARLCGLALALYILYFDMVNLYELISSKHFKRALNGLYDHDNIIEGIFQGAILSNAKRGAGCTPLFNIFFVMFWKFENSFSSYVFWFK